MNVYLAYIFDNILMAGWLLDSGASGSSGVNPSGIVFFKLKLHVIISIGKFVSGIIVMTSRCLSQLNTVVILELSTITSWYFLKFKFRYNDHHKLFASAPSCFDWIVSLIFGDRSQNGLKLQQRLLIIRVGKGIEGTQLFLL